ncbi:MAG: C10 family peptidase [Prevotella sp.]|nr:C10 family peptidase [Prevotella sp.]
MKKLLLLMIALLTQTLADAKQISEQEAMQKALQFLQGKQIITKDNARKMNRAPQKDANQAYYIFNVEKGGFVIVGGDDRVPEILGYSEHGKMDLDLAPSNVRWWLDYYSQYINSLDERSTANKVCKAPDSRPAITPMITSTWAQGSPYNEQCPTIDGQHCLTGCVATAMAQVMNYYQWPIQTTNVIPGYTTTMTGIDVPAQPITTIGWDKIMDQYNSWEEYSKEQIDAISNLMLLCGTSVKMEYSLDASIASGALVPAALINFFDYDGGAHIVYRDGYSDEDWENVIYQELQNGRPVIYGGVAAISGEGHAFICHGYADGLYYINWGWGSGELYDGYFALSMDPRGKEGYSFNQTAIIGIQKPHGGAADYKPITVTYMASPVSSVSRASNEDDFSVSFDWKIQNSLLETKNFEIGFALYQGNTLKELFAVGSGDLNPDDLIYSSTTLFFGANYPEGTYRLMAVYRENESSEWQKAEGAEHRSIWVKIEGNTLSLVSIGQYFTVETNGGTIIYVITDAANKRVELVSGYGLYGDVVIPETVEGYRVSSIGLGAFSGGCPDLQSISLPEGIITIPVICFFGCSNLKSIKLPSTVTTIKNGAFQCSGLVEFRANEGLKVIEGNAFYSCTSLKNVYISKTVTDIHDDAFAYCTAREFFEVENGNPIYDSRDNCGAIIITERNQLLCAGLNSFIPESVDRICPPGFSWLPTLTTLHVPKHVIEFSAGAFQDCWGLTTITVDPANLYFDSPGNSNVVRILGNAWAIEVGASNSYIPEGTQVIQSMAFKGRKGLKIINLPEGVVSVDEGAFWGCDDLMTVTFPSTLVRLGHWAFQRCPLSTIILPASLSDVKDNVFARCPLKEITSLSKNPIPIPDDMFSYNITQNGYIVEESETPDIIYQNAILYVPYGCKSKYQNTDGWKKFANIQEMSYVLMGDVNGDGSLSNDDIVVLSDAISGKDTSKYVNPQVADVNEDGFIDIRDVLKLTDMINEK